MSELLLSALACAGIALIMNAVALPLPVSYTHLTAVLQDAMMGTTVVVEHGGGLTSTYSNLASVPTVAVGDTVGAGSVLGSVGGTAIAESALASHLHFSMSLDGSTVDPLEYLPN